MISAVERPTQSDLQNQGQPKKLAVWPIGIRDQQGLNPPCLYSMSNSREAQDTLSLPRLKASQQVHPCKNTLTQRLPSLGEATGTASISIANVTQRKQQLESAIDLKDLFINLYLFITYTKTPILTQV